MWAVVVKFIFLILLTYSSQSRGAKCPLRWFDCGNGKCIAEIWHCDGDNDCGNLNDEKECESPLVLESCLSSQFECKSDQHCIPQRWRCDGDEDCVDGSDESQCDTVTEKCPGFICHNHQCIPKKWRCDGNEDCTDASDEELCPQSKLCTDSEFLCSSGSCVNQSLVCNGKNDCADGSDEGPHCGDSCANRTCSQNCKNTPTGPQCYCNEGYVLDSRDNKTCNDIDECQQEGFCSHKCTNTIGGYNCICHDGYELVNRTCKATGADPLLIFSTIREVRGIHLRSNQYFLVRQALTRASALDVDPKNQQIYWLEISNRSSVCTAKLDGSGFRIVLSHGLLLPEDIAVDYVTNSIYITDSGLRQVLVCKADGTICHVLHDTNIEKPRSIALNIDVGLMYWSDWGEHSSGIYRSGMDGSRRISVVSNRIGWPNGIALDHASNRLYWTDAKLNTIEFITLDGSERKVILNSTVFHPYSLTVFEDSIYWSDWSTFSLESCNKFTGHKMTILARENGRRIMGVHVYHPVLLARVSNPCWSNDCSHMCLISPVKGFHCACPHGFRLSTDEKTCLKEHGESIFVSEGSSVFYIQPKSVGSDMLTELPLSIGDAMITRVSYDSKSRYMFVADTKKPAIHAINMTSLHIQELVINYITSPEDLAFDWMSNNLYWIDSVKRTAEIININNLRRIAILSDLRPPVALAISPSGGCMFIATFGGQNSVAMYDMDGKNKRILHSVQGLAISLAVHPTESILYWAGPGAGISYVNYSSSRAAQMKTRIDGAMSIAASEEYIYWTARKRELNLFKENMTQVLPLPGQERGSVSRKVTYSPGITTAGLSACLIGNGGCSYLCLTSPAGRTCACLPEMTLSADNVSCVDRICENNHFKCMNGRCLPAEQRCDGSKDCEDGSDEAGCNIHASCQRGMFLCRNGSCIYDYEVCDGHMDCEQNEDESNCTHTSCQPGEMMCPSKRCILPQWICDGDPDCPDGSDEENCVDGRTHPPTVRTDSACEEFSCHATGLCLPWPKVCNSLKDCEDSSDEGGLCLTSCTNDNGGCSHACKKTPHGPKCICHKGFRLLSNNKTCYDIDECSEPGTCSHFCNNTRGSFKCSCAEGYVLSNDLHSCEAEGESASLMFSLGDRISIFDLRSLVLKSNISMKGAYIWRMDYDVTEGVFYWTEETHRSIDSYSVHTDSHEVIYRPSSRPNMVRYDWIAKNVYYLDGNSNIGVCTKDGKTCRTLVPSNTDRIDSFAISPTSGFMFWTIWAILPRYKPSGVIQRAVMNGSYRQNIVLHETISPTAITVDNLSRMIYWSDMQLQTLECADFYGFKRKKITWSRVFYPIALVVFEDYIYWHDWITRSVLRCHKLMSRNCERIFKDVKAYDILIAHKVMQPKVNSTCQIENGGCSHLCLLSPRGRTCSCSSAMILDVDGQTCIDAGKGCESGMYRCKDGSCVNSYQVCDGLKDCSNNEDELDCNPVTQSSKDV